MAVNVRLFDEPGRQWVALMGVELLQWYWDETDRLGEWPRLVYRDPTLNAILHSLYRSMGTWPRTGDLQ